MPASFEDKGFVIGVTKGLIGGRPLMAAENRTLSVVTSLTAFCMVCSGAYRPGVSVSLPAVNRVGPSWKMS